MRKVKKIMALVLAVLLMLSSITVFANDVGKTEQKREVQSEKREISETTQKGESEFTVQYQAGDFINGLQGKITELNGKKNPFVTEGEDGTLIIESHLTCKAGDKVTVLFDPSDSSNDGKGTFGNWSAMLLWDTGGEILDSSCFDNAEEQETIFTVPSRGDNKKYSINIFIEKAERYISVNNNTAEIYEIVNTDGATEDSDGVSNGYFLPGTKIRIKPIVPEVEYGYVAVFDGWENLPAEGIRNLEDNCIELTVQKGIDCYDIGAKYSIEDQRRYISLQHGAIYEIVNSDGTAGNVENAYGAYLVPGTVVKIKPVAPKVPEGFAAVFSEWKNLPEKGVKVLEGNRLEITISNDMVETYYNIRAKYVVKKENDVSGTEYCLVNMENDDWSSAVIKSVNGVKVDDLKMGAFKAGTILEIEYSAGFCWYQTSIADPGFAIGKFGNYEEKKTTYSVPNQEEIYLGVWGGGSVHQAPGLGMIRAVNSKIVALDNEILEKPVTEIRKRGEILVTVVADEMESTEEYDYRFVGWESASGVIEFTNPTEKTTQFVTTDDVGGSLVFAVYKAIPKKTEEAGDISVEVRTPIQGMKVDGLQEAVLTEQDKVAIAEGKNITISVIADEKESEKVGKEELALMQNVLTRNMTLGTILDIRIEKQIEGQAAEIVTELQKPVSITIDVPASLVNQDKNVKRTFSVVRLHEGKAELLADKDSNDATLTFNTDRFSLYGIAYEDKQIDNTSDVNGSENDTKKPVETAPKTADTTAGIGTMFLIVIMSVVVIMIQSKRKKYEF